MARAANSCGMPARPRNPSPQVRRPAEPIRPVPAVRAGVTLLSLQVRRRRYRETGLPRRRNA